MRIFLTSIFLLSTALLFAQQDAMKEPVSTAIIAGTYSYQFPVGDMAKRYGGNSAVGPVFLWKTRTNWLIGADFNFMFSKNVKNIDSITKFVTTSTGDAISNAGLAFDVAPFFNERGFTANLKVGKLIPAFGFNPNTGILLMGSAGLMYHWTKIQFDINDYKIPPLIDDYAKGYDRLSMGPTLSQFVGFFYMGDSRMVNFYGGFEFTEAWTKSIRDFDFALQKKDNKVYFDFLIGIKVGWMFPLYGKKPKEYYY